MTDDAPRRVPLAASHPTWAAVLAVLGGAFFVLLGFNDDGVGRAGRFVIGALLIVGGAALLALSIKNRDRPAAEREARLAAIRPRLEQANQVRLWGYLVIIVVGGITYLVLALRGG